MRIRTAVVAAIVLFFALTLATAPAGAQTNSSDYTTVCPPSGNTLGVAPAGHLSASGVSQAIDPNCPPTDVGANQLGQTEVSGQPLARTGSDSLPLVRIGLGLLAAGGLVVLFARGRRRRPTVAA
jgi:hypothetical protein